MTCGDGVRKGADGGERALATTLSVAVVWEFRPNMSGSTKLSRGPGSLDFYLKSLDIF